MSTTSEKHRGRIAKLMSDPRYWNDSHPEHPQVVADAQRAFRDAYPESSSDEQTSTGTVHVRAYTRTVDGKEIDVSAYDRLQKISMHGSSALQKAPSRNAIDDVSSNPEHDYVQSMTIAGLTKIGGRVAADVRVRRVSDGLASVPDIVAILPDGRHIVIEVKTGDAKWTKNQPEVYPLMAKGYEVFADDTKLEGLGFNRGERLPPFEVFVAYSEPPYRDVHLTPLDEAPIAPGKRLDDGHKGLR